MNRSKKKSVRLRAHAQRHAGRAAGASIDKHAVAILLKVTRE